MLPNSKKISKFDFRVKQAHISPKNSKNFIHNQTKKPFLDITNKLQNSSQTIFKQDQCIEVISSDSCLTPQIFHDSLNSITAPDLRTSLSSSIVPKKETTRDMSIIECQSAKRLEILPTENVKKTAKYVNF